MSAGVPMRELPRYKSHKIVHALKIHNIDVDSETGSAVITPEDNEFGPFGVDADYMGKHKPQSGGYYVVYEDGYKSWSPAEAFESGYTLIPESRSSSFDCALALGGKLFWQDLAKQLSSVWWEVSKVGGTLQHGDLEKPETMFSVVLEKHGGQCFHGETPMDAWKKSDAWLKSPDRPRISEPLNKAMEGLEDFWSKNGIDPSKPSQVSMEIAARVWCDQEMEQVVMDTDAAIEIARILDRVRVIRRHS